MSTKTTGRTYINNGKQPAGRNDDGIEQQVESKEVKKEMPDHCPPYNKDETVSQNKDYSLIPKDAHKYYHIVGAMTRNNFTPWTKFPTAGGHFFEENFAFWKNPYACRDPADVERNWKLSCMTGFMG
jgi:hypothetical protein